VDESCGVLGSGIELSSDFLMMAALINSLSVFLTGGSDSNHVSGPFRSVVDPNVFFFFSDPDPTLILISDPDSDLDPACL
jgi:hypothetical protein